MYRSYVDPKCEMGVILGTGTNACYIEKSDQIKKLPSSVIGDSGMIINMEWGGTTNSLFNEPAFADVMCSIWGQHQVIAFE